MTFRKIFNGRALYVENDIIWVAKGLSFYAIDYRGKRVTEKIRVGNFIERVISKFRLTRQLLRLGIHHLITLSNGNLLVTVKKKTYIIDKGGNIINVFLNYKGNKPAHRGICTTPEGYIFFGEYTLNTKRENETKLYRSRDNGATFECILTLSGKEVRHIHFVQWDDYEKCLWLGTGDLNHECKLMQSNDFGETWETVGQGSQLWRAIGISCTQDAIYWGTDAGSVPDKNYIVKMDRQTRKIESLFEIEGPCHGNAVLKDGTVFVSTGVEGGENEKDEYARFKKINNGEALEILKLKKDIIPLIVQYGVMRFPLGLEKSNILVFTSFGLKRYGEAVMIQDECKKKFK